MIILARKLLMATIMHKNVYSKWLKIDLDDIFGFRVVHSIVFDHPKWILAIFDRNQSFPGNENEFFGPKMAHGDFMAKKGLLKMV